MYGNLICNDNMFSSGLSYRELVAVKWTNNESSLFLIRPSSTDFTDVCQIWKSTCSIAKYEQLLLSNYRPRPHVFVALP